MTMFSRRLPHVLTQSDLAYLLAPTYAREVDVSEDLAHERLARALKRSGLADKIYETVSAALVSVQGTRAEDTLMNAMSKAVQKKLGNIGAPPSSPALSALMVSINIDIGVAPAELRATLESDKGKKLLDQGYETLGEYLVSQLIPRA